MIIKKRLEGEVGENPATARSPGETPTALAAPTENRTIPDPDPLPLPLARDLHKFKYVQY